jgi:hypothetical protein
MIAGFECHVKGRPFRKTAGGVESKDLGMGATGNFVVSAANDKAVFYHHCADHWIRRCGPFAFGGKIQCHIHEMTVIHNFFRNLKLADEVQWAKVEMRWLDR